MKMLLLMILIITAFGCGGEDERKYIEYEKAFQNRSIDLKESLRIYTIESNEEYNKFKVQCMNSGKNEDYCYKKFNASLEDGGQGGGSVKWNRPPTLFKPEGYDKWKREQK
tara:strand:- start:2143 stop:2475 length:333 start_codon:yes stop_codon:yes gene_type:complete